MKAMIRKELGALFHGLHGYLFFGIFWMLCGLFVTVYNLLYGSSAIEYTMRFLVIAVAIPMPFLTVRLFCHNDEEEQFLRHMPLSGKTVFFGKYLTTLAVLGIATLSVALLPLLFDFFGEVNYLSAYAALLGFFFLAHTFLTFQIFLATHIEKKWVAYLVSFGSVAGFIGLQSLGALLSDRLGRALDVILPDWLRKLFNTFLPFVYGRLDFMVILFYLFLSLVFFALAFWERSERRGIFEKLSVRILSVSMALLLATLSLIAARFPIRWNRIDVTTDKTYTISDSLEGYFSSIEEEITVWILEMEGGDVKFEYFLHDLATHSPKLTLKQADAEKDAALLEKAGVTAEEMKSIPYVLILESQYRVEVIDYYSLFYYVNDNTALLNFFQSYFDATEDGKMSWYEYQEYYYYLYQYGLQDSQYEQYLVYLVNDSVLYFQGESVLAAAMEYVAAERIPTKYVLEGHGEATMKGTVLEGLFSIYGKSIQPLTLSEAEGIPADAANVFLATPERDYTEGEVRALRDYLERGGTLTVLTDEQNLAMPNLMGLLAEYGMSASAGAVKEEIQVTEDDGETFETVISDEVEAVVNGQHDALAQTQEEKSLIPVITGGNAISFLETSDRSLILNPLLSTSEKGIVGDAVEEKGVRILAAAAENNRGARLCWFTGADSYMVALSEVSASDAAIFNNFCLYLSLDWTDFEYRSALTLPHARPYQTAPMQVKTSVATGFGVVTVLLIPLALVGIGVVIRYRRKKMD